MRTHTTTAQAAVGLLKHWHLNRYCLILSLLWGTFGQVPGQMTVPPSAYHFCGVSPYPEPTSLTQPDGTQLQLRIYSTNHAYYLETLDGFTILKDPSDGYYKYVVGGFDGDLFLSNIIANPRSQKTPAEKMITNQVSSHLRYTGKALAVKQSRFQEALTNAAIEPPGVFPATGVRKALLLLIKYPDLANTYSVPAFDNLANQAGYNVNGQTGSFRDYYQDISYNALTINTDVRGWYTASNSRATYGHGESPGDFTKAIPLIREAVDAAEANGVDFSQYDGDGDGRVDVVMIIHAGRGTEESGDGDDIWSHRWALSAGGMQVTYDGKLINDYIIQPEKLGATNIANIGVLCHEFGHALGLPDLYDTDGSSSGLGRWCLMAGGTWNNGGKTPAHMSAWCKAELGWINHTVLTNAGTITNMDYIDHAAVGFRINTPESSEYFLLENRQKIGWDASLPSSGLAIYHIDETRSGNTNEARYKVNLEQADGLMQLNNDVNSGDGGDLFPGSTNNIALSCISNPNSDTYDDQTSNNQITGIVTNANLINFNYGACQTCSGTPNPGNTLTTNNAPCMNETFTLSLANIFSEAGISYQWQSSTNNNTWTNVSEATDSEAQISISENTWFRCVVTCSSNSQTNESASILISLGYTGTCYCEASGLNEDYEKIGSVIFNEIDNTSEGTGGYEDFTGLSTSIIQGQSYTFTAQISGPFDEDQILVWIDYNRNGSFADAGEAVFVSPTGIGPHSSTITIPPSATLGATMMRVRLHDSGLGPNTTPCGESQYGQVEDYTVIIGSPDCENSLTLSSPTNDINSGSHKFEVNADILAQNKITSGSIIFDAGVAITLQPYFSIELGAELTLQIDGCGNQ